MADPASSEYQQKVEDALDQRARAAELAIADVVARRLKAVSEGESLTDALAHLAADMREIERITGKAADEIAEAAQEALRAMTEDNAAWAQPYYEAAGATAGGAAAAIGAEAAKEAAEGVRSACQTSVMRLAVPDGDGGFRTMPIRNAYIDLVSRAAADMATGTATGRKAVSQAVSEALRGMSAHAVRVEYESGTTRELYAAVRANVMDTYRRAMGEQRLAMGAEFGADGYEISAHALCAPDHLPYQGRQYTVEQFDEIQRLLDRDLTTGANCRHIAYPILLGVSDPAYSPADLDELARLTEREVEITGLSGEPRTVTRYEASQYQRMLEKQLRQSKALTHLQETAGADTAQSEARTKLLSAVYRRVSAEANISTHPERTRISIPS